MRSSSGIAATASNMPTSWRTSSRALHALIANWFSIIKYTGRSSSSSIPSKSR
eukprot:CAMPEP_0182612266 /NCGR_PEP_ID=MMETSP1330-20130603/17440_1 /TAXON_ID=464278 /ORGANISM="Picochlorum sp., Strain RCC944" /LENGTH=52 /DNA_ID=CAMNT_0024831783 /DNA_START=88 /DNA_END=242 /DNA_ORIENTATION=-